MTSSRRLFSRLPTRVGVAMALAVVLVTRCASAHIGSPNVFFEGPAGPYLVRVTVEPPGVVPGLAQIHVRVQSGHPQTVTVLPVRWDIGTRGSPPPDAARSVPGETNLFTAQLWFMDSGSYSVFVDVSGPEGRGTAIIPVNSLAYQRLGMSRGMTVLFACLGLFLVVLLVSVAGAAARESILPPGAEPAPRQRRLAILAMAVATFAAVGVVTLGNRWWNAVDRDYRSSRLYRAGRIEPTLETGTNGTRGLVLRLEPSRRTDSSPLVPDHGQIMHLFLIRQPEGDAFAHLHPVHDAGAKGNVFRTMLPPLPAGDYQLYADITHESGLTQTLTNVMHLDAPAIGANPELLSPDDAFDLEPAAAPAPVELDGGFRLTPHFGGKFRVNEETTLRFDLTTAAGTPAPLEPYLGMYGHLMIQRDDGQVFAHLHPLGTISMTAQRLFAEREHASYLANRPLELLCTPPSTELAFPYAFPRPGAYRLWLQTKLDGRIRTSAYAITVE